MRRRLFGFFPALSLLLFLAVCAGGAASMANDAWWLCWSDGRLLLIGADGQAAALFANWYIDPSAGNLDSHGGLDGYRGRHVLWEYLRMGYDPIGGGSRGPWHAGGAGVDIYVAPGETRPSYRIVAVHGGYAALAALVLPLWATGLALRRRRRSRHGRCPTCGYDLTGNVSGVCPECGTAKALP